MSKVMVMLALALFGLAGILAGCGGGGNDGNSSQDTTVHGQLLRGDTDGPVRGATVRVLATTSRAAGKSVLATTTTSDDGGYTLRFSSTGDTTITIVAEPPAGSDLAQIELSMTVSAGSTINNVAIRVIPTNMASQINAISVTPQSAEVQNGTTRQFQATVLDANQQALALHPTWTVESANNIAVGVIDGTGKFTALRPGTCSVVAICGDKRSAATVTVTEPIASPLRGTWISRGANNKPVAVISFVDDTHFMNVFDQPMENLGFPGMESGIYSWNQRTGAFTARVDVDTNGSWGFSNPPSGSTTSFTVNGNTATFSNSVEGSHTTTRLTQSAKSPLVGGWIYSPSTYDTHDAVFLAFTDDYHYVYAQSSLASEDGRPGIETGSYTWDSKTGIITVSVGTDTNGTWGFSNPPVGSTTTVTVNGNTATFSNSVEGSHTALRVLP